MIVQVLSSWIWWLVIVLVSTVLWSRKWDESRYNLCPVGSYNVVSSYDAHSKLPSWLLYLRLFSIFIYLIPNILQYQTKPNEALCEDTCVLKEEETNNWFHSQLILKSLSTTVANLTFRGNKSSIFSYPSFSSLVVLEKIIDFSGKAHMWMRQLWEAEMILFRCTWGAVAEIWKPSLLWKACPVCVSQPEESWLHNRVSPAGAKLFLDYMCHCLEGD